MEVWINRDLKKKERGERREEKGEKGYRKGRDMEEIWRGRYGEVMRGKVGGSRSEITICRNKTHFVWRFRLKF